MVTKKDDKEISQTVNILIDDWCERRNLAALGIILRAWPLPMGLTDDWAKLLDALKDLNGVKRDALTEDEVEIVDQLIIAVEGIVYR